MHAKWVTSFPFNHLILHQVLLLPIQGLEVSAISFRHPQSLQLYDLSDELGHICVQDLCWTEPSFLCTNLAQQLIQDVIDCLTTGFSLSSLSFL